MTRAQSDTLLGLLTDVHTWLDAHKDRLSLIDTYPFVAERVEAALVEHGILGQTATDTRPRAASILDLAVFRGARSEPGSGGLTGDQFAAVGLDMIGGCQCCHATIAAYNAFPSRSGYWRCEECIGADGYATVEEADAAIFGLTARERWGGPEFMTEEEADDAPDLEPRRERWGGPD